MKSRVNREVHAWICEGLGVKFPGATRPTTTGHVPAPRSLTPMGFWASNPENLLRDSLERWHSQIKIRLVERPELY